MFGRRPAARAGPLPEGYDVRRASSVAAAVRMRDIGFLLLDVTSALFVHQA